MFKEIAVVQQPANAASVTGDFLYMGSANGNDLWALQLSGGSTVSFVTQTNSLGLTPVLSATTSAISTSKWTQIVLTYSDSADCSLYVNGVGVGSTSGGNTNWPRLSNRALGLVLGNNGALNSPINGQIDELETFNYQLSASDIASNFQAVARVDSDLNGIPDYLEDISLSTNRPFLGEPVVITGVVEAEQFDMGGNGVAYHTTANNPPCSYRPTGMFITNCDDILGATNITQFGYCLAKTHAGEWVDYTIEPLVAEQYTVEVRVKGNGTNGLFGLSFSNAASGVYATNMVKISSTNWGFASTNLTLTNGIQTMRLSFIANGTNNGVSTGEVGEFNYISIYPYWKHGSPGTNNLGISLTSLTEATDWSNGLANAAVIQSKLTWLANNGGGLLTLPAGTYHVSQTHPYDDNPSSYNAALYVMGNNIVLAGTNNGSTALVADNRATTVLMVGRSNLILSECTNFTLRDLTLIAQPHEVAVESGIGYAHIFEKGQQNAFATNATVDTNTGIWSTNIVSTNGDTGCIVGITGYSRDLFFSNCTFLHGIQAMLPDSTVTGYLVENCKFLPWDTTNWFDGTTNTGADATAFTGPYHFSEANVFSGTSDVVFIGNSYDANSALVYTNNTFGDSATNNAPDGLFWSQMGGNIFAARNSITNYSLEAIQLNAGPNGVAGNIFCSLVSDSACTALWAGALWPGVTGAGLSNEWTSFVANWIYGGQRGEEGNSIAGYSYNLNFSGNWLTLYPPFDSPKNSPGSLAAVRGFAGLFVTGNTLNYGSTALDYADACTNVVLLDNDLSGVSYRGIGRVTAPGGSIQNAIVFGNKLSEGPSFHAQLPIPSAWGWFFESNTYMNPLGQKVAVFSDPAASDAHFNP